MDAWSHDFNAVDFCVNCGTSRMAVEDYVVDCIPNDGGARFADERLQAMNDMVEQVRALFVCSVEGARD